MLPKFSALSLLLLLFVACQNACAAKPNLLVIITDEHHYNTLGCYGGTIVETPHIDWLANNGALCTSFYATTPVCSPSRASLMTGLYPQATPVINNNIPLQRDLPTFASLLQQHGYATGYAGKWHLDGDGKPQWAPKRKFGFDDNRFMFNRGHWKMFDFEADQPRVASRSRKGVPNYGIDGANAESFSTDWLTDRAIQFIRKNKADPFCYVLSLPDPHGPNTVRPPYDTMFSEEDVYIPASLKKPLAQTPNWAKPEVKLTADKLRNFMPNYYGMVKCIDDNMGRLIEELRTQDILENTLIVFTSDHGDLCGEHGRLNKGVPYEGSARIPFIAYYPPKIPKHTVVPQALSCIDFLPTALSLMDIEHSVEVHGRDASTLLQNDLNGDWDDITFLRSTGAGNWLCALTDRYKLVIAANERPWLLDLETDPEELINQYGKPEYEEIGKTLRNRLAEYVIQYEDPAREVKPVALQLGFN